MLPTPDTGHVSYDRIYEPAEDSYLLLDTLASPSETAFLHQHFATTKCAAVPLVFEVGTGSGVVLAFATAHANHIFGRSDVVTLGCDINAFACEAASTTVQRAVEDSLKSFSRPSAQFVNVVNADLTSCIRPGSIDVLIFNPPYVPAELPDLSQHDRHNLTEAKLSSSEAFDRDSHLLSLSYAGGVDGMEITNRLLAELPTVLSQDRGIAYVLVCAQNKPADIMARIESWPGSWYAEIVGHSGKKAGWEKLSILRIGRRHD